jgi:hypothetical protein
MAGHAPPATRGLPLGPPARPAAGPGTTCPARRGVGPAGHPRQFGRSVAHSAPSPSPPLRSIIGFRAIIAGVGPRGRAAGGPSPVWDNVHDRNRITAASRWRRESGCGAQITGAVAQLPAAAGSALEPSESELEVSLRHLVWQAQSLQRCSVFRHPLVTGGHHQHHALRLRVVHRGWSIRASTARTRQCKALSGASMAES